MTQTQPDHDADAVTSANNPADVGAPHEPNANDDNPKESARATVERITAIVAELHIDPASIKAAPRHIQLGLLGSSTVVVASFFEWWTGFAWVRGIVNYSATGAGSAYSDWRGWIAVAFMIGVIASLSWQLARPSTPLLRKATAAASLGALVSTLWFWAAFIAVAGLSDGLSVNFGASFGLYLGLAGAITATVATVNHYRNPQNAPIDPQ